MLKRRKRQIVQQILKANRGGHINTSKTALRIGYTLKQSNIQRLKKQAKKMEILDLIASVKQYSKIYRLVCNELRCTLSQLDSCVTSDKSIESRFRDILPQVIDSLRKTS